MIDISRKTLIDRIIKKSFIDSWLYEYGNAKKRLDTKYQFQDYRVCFRPPFFYGIGLFTDSDL